jgi:hypothetical protein
VSRPSPSGPSPWTRFSRLRTPMPYWTAWRASEFRWALACLLATLLHLPARLSRVHRRGLKAACCRGRVSPCPLHALWLPRPSMGSIRFTQGISSRLLTAFASPFAQAPSDFDVSGCHRKQGLSGWVFPVGLGTLLAHHHGTPEPSTASWRLPAKEPGLLPSPRLRTGRESFPSSSSSLE